MSFDYDLIVIGAGSGGVRLSRMAANKGWKVAAVEERYLGGTCVNVGCVPKKLFVYASEYPAKFSQAKNYGVNGTLESIDWPTLRDNKTNEINITVGHITEDIINKTNTTNNTNGTNGTNNTDIPDDDPEDPVDP